MVGALAGSTFVIGISALVTDVGRSFSDGSRPHTTLLRMFSFAAQGLQ